MATEEAKVEPKIVSAVGVVVGTTSNDPNTISKSKQVEKAMSQAVLDCMSKGILDPDEQKKAMMAAREKVLKGAD